MSVDDEWMNFKETINTDNINPKKEKNIELDIMPKCTNIYISTQTKIAYLNQKIDLDYLFWNLPVIDYFSPKNGIIKKSIKINCTSQEDLDKLHNNTSNQKNISITELSSVKNKKKFKEVFKIDVGLCEKDIISYRKKQKGAFYNCFAIIIRILYKNIYKEVHVKIFNTGKLEIPGIQFDELLNITLDNLIKIIQPYLKNTISYDIRNILFRI